MADSDDDFLKRWSRRKRGLGAEPAAEAGEAGPAAAPEPLETGGEAALTEEEAARRKALIEQLPDIETLDESSDFTAFLQEGVPEELKRRALRRLWRLNPVFANLDGLAEYDEDFTDAALVAQGVKTLYQVGKGMVMPEEPKPEAATPAEASNRGQAEGAGKDESVPEEVEDNAEGRSETAETPAQIVGEDSSADESDVAPMTSASPVRVATSRPKQPAARRRWQRFES